MDTFYLVEAYKSRPTSIAHMPFGSWLDDLMVINFGESLSTCGETDISKCLTKLLQKPQLQALINASILAYYEQHIYKLPGN